MMLKKFFAGVKPFPSFFQRGKAGKSRCRRPKHALNIRLNFIVMPREKRDEYIQLLDRMIKRVEQIINSNRTDTKTRLRALEVLTKLIQASYELLRDVEVEQLEQEVARLEAEAAGAPQQE